VLIQTEKVHHFPVIALDRAYWQGLKDWIEKVLLAEGAIAPEDLDLLELADRPEEAVARIREYGARLGS